MSRLPTLFISHGSPMLAIVDSPARRFLRELGQSLPRPQAIIVVSAHWEALGGPAVSLAKEPSTIHDFGGFPQALYELHYPAPGAPQAAERAAGLLQEAGFQVRRSADRGLDHGAWIPLREMFPDADIPTAQLTVLRGGSAAAHEQMGSALQALRDEGVLLLGSGSLTHNLYEYFGQEPDAPLQPWVGEFAEWMHANLESNRREALRDYRAQAPFAVRNHPTDEHLMPLFVAMGAGGEQAKAQRIHASYEYGVIAMDAYSFN